MQTMNVGIIGAGHIAQKMTRTLNQLGEVKVLAVGSRSKEKAHEFAREQGVERAYCSYEELLADPDVDLVYVATPHSHHFEPTRQALLSGKAALVEKAFTANAREAEELIRISQQRGVLLAEAIWTRYMPISHQIGEILKSGAIGEPKLLSASLCYKIDHKERLQRADLCGGALLDVGVYALNFARMYFGSNITRTVTNCQLGSTGMDMQESISLSYAEGRMANLQCGALCHNDRQGVISGSEGYLVVDNVNNPCRVDVYHGFELAQTITRPASVITGYEYEVLECKRCLEQGLVESPMMPHAEILAVMQQMDALRKEWGVKYPMD